MKRNPAKDGHARVITVSGGKGGVGKTFFTVNFAASLAQQGHRVLIFDADLNFSNVAILTRVNTATRFQDFIDAKATLGSLVKRGVGGIDVIFAGEDLNHLIDVSEDIGDVLLLALRDLEEDYDFILIDSPAGLNKLVIGMMVQSDDIILVTNPDIAALSDLYRLIKIVATEKDKARFQIVMNKVNTAEQAVEVFKNVNKVAKQFKLKAQLGLLGYILNDARQVLASFQAQTPIVLMREGGKITACFELILKNFQAATKTRRPTSFFNALLKGLKGS